MGGRGGGLQAHRAEISTKACAGRMMVLGVCVPLLPLNSNAEMPAPPPCDGLEGGAFGRRSDQECRACLNAASGLKKATGQLSGGGQ